MVDAIQKVSTSKPESRAIMPGSLPSEKPSSMLNYFVSKYQSKRNMPTSLEPGKKTFLPSKQQPYDGQGVGGPHNESVGPTTKQQPFGDQGVGGPQIESAPPTTKQQPYGGRGVSGPNIWSVGLTAKQQPFGGRGVSVPNIRSVGPTSKKGKTDHSYFKGYFSPESFGTYQEVMDALSKPVSSYSLLYESPSVHKPFVRPSADKPPLPPKRKPKANTKLKAITMPKENTKPVVRAKSSVIKSKSDYRFPKNVKDLTGTRMFDGVPVKYVLASVEKLHGTIKGEVYLCGCDSCDDSMTYTADDFENHAQCKTSHANNHIRFLNGKTIHQVVKELQGTPDHMLFDAIKTVTGSPINQEAFCAWKEKYQAAKAQT
ncbi:hypothetical protein CASFOL_015990 [Castilleja foliolosa]|uniref:Tify domain-containing protein n=1 Tax=Castilleja foliolosa TaxID=1961234 RepID=A0ABD3DG72_9LAMI